MFWTVGNLCHSSPARWFSFPAHRGRSRDDCWFVGICGLVSMVSCRLYLFLFKGILWFSYGFCQGLGLAWFCFSDVFLFLAILKGFFGDLFKTS